MNGNDFTTNRTKLILFFIAILSFGIFLGKNTTPTQVWIFFWKPSVPLIVIALVCFFLGCLCGWILSVTHRKRIEEE
ncbi:MAG: LapA family protein [Candidatus Omnitrophota bacterium]|jgi:uncharacterized integral membrane protein|nr:MAG: LapA family protein [Candidatus Omnitrophota bacterium]